MHTNSYLHSADPAYEPRECVECGVPVDFDRRVSLCDDCDYAAWRASDPEEVYA